jgi:acetoin utilization protein AcuB
MKVRDWMTTDPFLLTADQPIKVAVQQQVENRIRHMPVILDGELVGILTDRDLKRALPSVMAGATPEEYRAFMEGTAVSKVMTPNPVTCTPDTDLREAVRIFVEHKFGAIPVVEDGQVVAILCQTDALRALLSLLEEQR